MAYWSCQSRCGCAELHFINSLADSPLAPFLFGDVNNHTASNASSTTIFTNGVSTLSASATAAADLATRDLHASAAASYGYSGACSNCNSPFVAGNANFGDSLTFLGSFSGQAVTFQATITGTWTTNCAASCVGPGAATSNCWLCQAVQSIQIPGTNLRASAQARPTLDIAGKAFNIGNSFGGDFTDTANIQIIAPPGVTILSASGVFPQPVPRASLSSAARHGPCRVRGHPTPPQARITNSDTRLRLRERRPRRDSPALVAAIAQPPYADLPSAGDEPPVSSLRRKFKALTHSGECALRQGFARRTVAQSPPFRGIAPLSRIVCETLSWRLVRSS